MQHNTRLIYTFDNYIGDHGWRVKRFPFFNVSNALGLTHDILEHSRNDSGTWYEEISAFGAIVAYRGNMSDLLYPVERNVHDKIVQLGKELAGILEKPAMDNPEFFTKVKDTYKRISSWHYGYVDLLAEETAGHIKELSGSSEEETKACLLSWLSYGYSRASRVIESSGWDAPYIWEEVENTITSALFDSRRDFYEGNEVSVQIDFERCRCDVVPINCKYVFN